MKIVILGAGQVGSTLAESLCTEHDVTVVDHNPQAIDKLQSKFDIQAICGHAISPQILTEAGAERADMLIAVTSNDETNIVACQIAFFLFKTPIKIARIRYAELQKFADFFDPRERPIDLVIDPTALVTEQLEEQIKHPLFSSIWSFVPEQKLHVASIAVSPLSKLNHMSLSALSENLKTHAAPAKIVAIARNEEILFPSAVNRLEPYDELLICAPEAELNKVGKLIVEDGQESYKRLMIAGAGRIGRGLAARLEEKCQVKLIEVSTEYSQKAANSLNNSLVLQGDATDVGLLKQENIADMDLFCAVTNDDDVNIMSAILAKRLGAKHTIALVNQQTYAHYLIERSPDVDIAISPQTITGSKILRVLYKNTFANIYAIFGGAGYLLEIVLEKEWVQLKLPKTCRLLAVYRGDEVLFDGDTLHFAANDHLIFVLQTKKDLRFFTELKDKMR